MKGKRNKMHLIAYLVSKSFPIVLALLFLGSNANKKDAKKENALNLTINRAEPLQGHWDTASNINQEIILG